MIIKPLIKFMEGNNERIIYYTFCTIVLIRKMFRLLRGLNTIQNFFFTNFFFQAKSVEAQLPPSLARVLPRGSGLWQEQGAGESLSAAAHPQGNRWWWRWLRHDEHPAGQPVTAVFNCFKLATTVNFTD